MEDSRLDKLEARMLKLRQMIAKEKRRDSEKKRKERTHRLIKRGGLIEMVLGENVDAGLLTGLLAKNKALFENATSPQAVELKAIGDRLISEQEAANKSNKAKASEGDAAGEAAATASEGAASSAASTSYSSVNG